MAFERFQYLLPCGHMSAGLACFQCVVEDYLAAERAAEKREPGSRAAVPRELTITVAHPPHVQRFGIPRPKR